MSMGIPFAALFAAWLLACLAELRDGALPARVRTVIPGQNPAYHVLVDFAAEGMRDL
jgi:hypothetical protein